MATNATRSKTHNVEQRAKTIKTMLQAQANDYGEVPEDARVTITVSYENHLGNTATKHGQLWRAVDDKINFSENVGEDDENPFYIRFSYKGLILISVSERGTETEIGEITNIVIED